MGSAGAPPLGRRGVDDLITTRHSGTYVTVPNFGILDQTVSALVRVIIPKLGCAGASLSWYGGG